MSVPSDPSVGGSSDSDKISAGMPTIPPVPKAKEQEPKVSEENKIMAVDKELLVNVQGQVKEVVQARPEPELPPDVADAGVISPIAKAEEVVKDGTTLTLPTTEEAYKRGLHLRFAGVVTSGVVMGASSLSALAMWIGRMIKMAHKKAIKVVFRGGE
jgi:hypothetical protein